MRRPGHLRRLMWGKFVELQNVGACAERFKGFLWGVCFDDDLFFRGMTAQLRNRPGPVVTGGEKAAVICKRRTVSAHPAR